MWRYTLKQTERVEISDCWLMGVEGDGLQRQTGDCCFYNRPWKTIAFLNHVPVLLIKIKIEK